MQLELHYSKSNVSQRENCDLCNSAVAYSENKLLTCTNPNCGVIYKDVLDQAAEWRYYGAEDSSMVDPTRCGMPINPLLKESSYAEPLNLLKERAVSGFNICGSTKSPKALIYAERQSF